MAADILLYQATHVPVGGDQDQHVELARDLAIRFNHTYGPTFTVPHLVRAGTAARVRDLQNPSIKMSKSASDDDAGVIRILDDPDTIRRKISRAVTDSKRTVCYDPVGQPGVSNLLDILAACTQQPPQFVAEAFTGSGYGQLKSAVTDAVIANLQPIQRQVAKLTAAPDAVHEALDTGRRRTTATAAPVLQRATAAIGLTTD